MSADGRVMVLSTRIFGKKIKAEIFEFVDGRYGVRLFTPAFSNWGSSIMPRRGPLQDILRHVLSGFEMKARLAKAHARRLDIS